MSPDRRLTDLNPPDRPGRAPAIAPPAPRPTSPQPASPAYGQARRAQPSQPGGRVPVASERASKVMHSVPIDMLDRLKQAANRSGRSYTDIVVACIVDHRDQLARTDSRHVTPLGALDRRRERADRPRHRAGQLTLYLTAGERAELDGLAASLGIPRSQLVTAALQQGLNELP